MTHDPTCGKCVSGIDPWHSHPDTPPGSAASLEAARDASLVALADAWTELRGYVQAAIEDGAPINPTSLVAYMDELRDRARTPLREAIRKAAGDVPA